MPWGYARVGFCGEVLLKAAAMRMKVLLKVRREGLCSMLTCRVLTRAEGEMNPSSLASVENRANMPWGYARVGFCGEALLKAAAMRMKVLLKGVDASREGGGLKLLSERGEQGQHALGLCTCGLLWVLTRAEGEMNPSSLERVKNTTNMLYGYARMGFCDESLLKAAATRMKLLLKDPEGRIVDAVSAPGFERYIDCNRRLTVRYMSDEEEMLEVVLTSDGSIQQRPADTYQRLFISQNLSDMAWALAVAKHHDVELFEMIAARAMENAHMLGKTSIVDLATAFATTEIQHAALMSALEEAALALLPDFSPSYLSDTLWAFAVLQHQPSEEFLRAGGLPPGRGFAGFVRPSIAGSTPEAQEDATPKRIFSKALSVTSRFLRLEMVKLAQLKGNTLSPSQEAAVLGASQAPLRGVSRSSDCGSRDASHQGASLLQLSCHAPNTVEDHVEACALPRSSGFTPLVQLDADMNLQPNANPRAFKSQLVRRKTDPVNELTDTVQLREACSDVRAPLASPMHNDAAYYTEAVDPVAQSSLGCAQRSTPSFPAFLEECPFLDRAAEADNVDSSKAYSRSFTRQRMACLDEGPFLCSVPEADDVDSPQARASCHTLLPRGTAMGTPNAPPYANIFLSKFGSACRKTRGKAMGTPTSPPNANLFEAKFGSPCLKSRGTAMGTPVAPPYANLFLAEFEGEIIESLGLELDHSF
eukprot:gene16689-22951_t